MEYSKVQVQFMIDLFNVLSYVYDFVTFPIYFLIQKPWLLRENSRKIKAKAINSSNDEITIRSTDTPKELHLKLLMNNIDTLEKMFKFAAKLNTTKRCIGTREVLGEISETQKDGRIFKKYQLGDYKWLNFTEVELKAKFFGRGVREIGVKSKDRVVIFAETRAEWIVAAHGLFKHGCTIVTIYATLGEDGISHGIDETEVDTIITSHDLLPKIRKIIKTIPRIKNVIFFEDKLQKTDTSNLNDVNVYSFDEIVQKGSESEIEEFSPKENDIAIIMYTSGSTGTPKGVLLSHKNIMSTLKSMTDNFEVRSDDVYIGFLPLAHVLELVGESCASLVGVPIGYSSAMTLLDSSPKIMKGCKGDTSVLQPTCMTSVPLILDRIVKGINDKVNNGSFFLQTSFKFAYDYKVKWTRRGYRTPLIDHLIFSKVAKILGGRVRVIVSGGAPLSSETHEKVKLCMCTELLQGYGLTETTAGASVMSEYDLTFGHVGSPLSCNEIRLENWNEGNYRVTNKPHPQGEIIVGGDNVALGYYKLPEKTVESFFEENGKRWFRTGDIGEFHDGGILNVIDRKKDLVKLQQGEYVSLGKVEAELKTCSLIDNVCVYGDPTKTYCVALIVPAENFFKEFAVKSGFNGSFSSLFDNEDFKKIVLKEINDHAKKSRLERFEIPSAITLCNDIWSPDTGLVTAAFKIKRKDIQEKYKNEIKKMYEQ